MSAGYEIRTLYGALAILFALSLTACQRDDASAQARESAPEETDPQGALALSAEQIQRLGMTRRAATGVSFTPEVRGYGVVLGHDVIAQSVADVVTASAAARQSQTALARVKGLAATPGAFSAEALESAERQASADAAGLALTRRKLSAMWGEHSPWREEESSALLREVASGKAKLVRVTFPLGVVMDATPKMLALSRLAATGSRPRWQSTAIWDAPADAAVPGRSFFVLLENSDAAEGERLDAWTSVGTPLMGVWIPQSAIVISDGQYWCYVEQEHGFERRAIDASQPMNGGYFVQNAVSPGEVIVTQGAALLLARETNPSTEAD